MLYLKLFHGRKDPDENLDNWGEDGPLLGPFVFLQTTYAAHIKFETVDADIEDEFLIINDLVYYDGMYYGDWTALSNIKNTLPAPVQVDVSKLKPPGKQKYSEQRPDGSVSWSSSGNPTPLEFHTYLDVSTRHISVHDNDLLGQMIQQNLPDPHGTAPDPTESVNSLIVYGYDCGFFVAVPDSDLIEERLEAAKDKGITKELCDIVRLARERNCDFVRIDRDGKEYEQFKDFDW